MSEGEFQERVLRELSELKGDMTAVKGDMTALTQDLETHGRWVRETFGHMANGGLAKEIAVGVVEGLQKRGLLALRGDG